MSLRIIGGQGTRIHEAVDERPHAIADHPDWQESVVLVWYDPVNRIGGMHRIGHEPHQNGGQAILWTTIFLGTKRLFKRTEVHPLQASDQFPTGFAIGNYARYTYDEACRWQVEDDGISLDLTIADFHPSIDLWPVSIGKLSDVFARSHLEAGGTISGDLTVGDRHHHIQGYCYRDHSWGIRHWNSFLSHRWICGVLGDRRSFGLITWHAVDGSLRSSGYIVEKDLLRYATSIDVLAYMDIDALTNRGGAVEMIFADGGTLSLKCSPVTLASISHYRDVSCVDRLCTVTDGVDHGYCVFETTTNAQQGTALPIGFRGSFIGNGYYEEPSVR
jgi:hypothetical protein